MLDVTPPGRLKAHADKLAGKWCAFRNPIDVKIWDNDAAPIHDIQLLPELVWSHVSEASRTFRNRTAQPCGTHPGHFASLSRPALDALALLCNLCEAYGRYPRCLQFLDVGLICQGPKRRPIGLYNAFVRAHGKTRQMFCDPGMLRLPKSSQVCSTITAVGE